MKILLAGGGSGGHVTPLNAIASELQQRDSATEFIVLTDRSFYEPAKQIFAENKNTSIKKIFAGKIRRYHGRSLLWHILHVPTLLKNLRDVLYLGIGVVQSLGIFLRQRPDVVFCKGGFVCVPVGWVAQLFKVPLVIHDSDTKPGLTNRILSKYAQKIATGMPVSFYPYDSKKMTHTGMPVSRRYKPQSAQQQAKLKENLGFKDSQPVLLLTGGGNGSQRLNTLLSQIAGDLLEAGWGIVQLTGSGKSNKSKAMRNVVAKEWQSNWHIVEFTDDMPSYLLAADIVIARTSASTLQECANAQKVVIGIASPYLADQKMNSEYFVSKDAITAMNELEIDEQGRQLLESIEQLYSNKKQAQIQAENLYNNFAKPNAAAQLAEIIYSQA